MLIQPIAVSRPAAAQDCPSKPTRMIVPYQTSTVSGLVDRLLASHMSKDLGQPITVENIPAAGGIVGKQQFVQAPKDGYTIAILNNGHAINPSVNQDPVFDTRKDMEPINSLGSSPQVLDAGPALPTKDVKELLELARTKKRDATYGSMGNGTIVHLKGEMLTQEGDMELKHGPNSSAAQMMADVIGGQIDIAFMGVATAAARVEGGKMRALAVTTRQRSSLMPNVPTLVEQCLPNYQFDDRMVLAALAGPPRVIVNRLNAELKAELAQKDVQEAMAKIGVTTTSSIPEQTAQFFRTELERHSLLAKRGGATLGGTGHAT